MSQSLLKFANIIEHHTVPVPPKIHCREYDLYSLVLCLSKNYRMAVDLCDVVAVPLDDHKGAGELRDVADETLVQLRAKLLDNNLPLSARYRALYSLRNAKGEQACEALRCALKLEAVPSALLRHDVAFCLGQRQEPAAVEALVRSWLPSL